MNMGCKLFLSRNEQGKREEKKNEKVEVWGRRQRVEMEETMTEVGKG